MSVTKIYKCSCSHSYQDEKYGKANRVHNQMKKEGCWKCTVCGNNKKS
jgi:hypothetical protein